MFHRRKVLAVLGTVGVTVGAAAAVSAVSGPAAAAAGCRVDYAVSSQWPGGFTAAITITNLGDPVDGWRLTWAFTAGQRVTAGWNASYSGTSSVTATNASWNGSLGTGGTAVIGFNGSWTGSNPSPASFALNGVTCTGSTTTTPAPPPTTPPPTTTPPPPPPPTGGFPSPTGQQAVSATIEVSGTFDGTLRRFFGSGPLGSDGQDEDQPPIFELANGATLQNVILGAPAADGVHCNGSCTLRNVWWEDVGEDAATFRASSASQTMLIDGGGARRAEDKVFQHNGAGTMTIRDFQVEDFGKLYRSCGNCSSMFQRHAVIDNVTVRAPGDALAGVNANFGDTARITRITIVGDPDREIAICERWNGNDDGDEPTKIGEGPDPTNCLYDPADITYR